MELTMKLEALYESRRWKTSGEWMQLLEGGLIARVHIYSNAKREFEWSIAPSMGWDGKEASSSGRARSVEAAKAEAENMLNAIMMNKGRTLPDLPRQE